MATYQIPAPEPFDFSSTEDWPKWIRRFERFRQSSELSGKSQENQISTLIYSMGDRAEDIFQSFHMTDEQARDYDVVRQKFDDYFTKKKNVIYERAKFNMRRQEEGEAVDSFITSLHTLAAKCEYGGLSDDLIRDRIVVGIRNQSLSERMQLDETLTLEKAAKMARENEAVRNQQSQIRETEKKEIEVIRRRPTCTSSGKGVGACQNSSKRNASGGTKYRLAQNPANNKSPALCGCTRCGKNHTPGKEACPAKQSKCFKCGKIGHFNRMCKSAVNTIQVKTGDDSESEEDKDWKFLGVITEQNSSGQWMTEIKMNRQTVRFKIDMGADVTVIPVDTYNKFRDGPLQQSKSILVGPGRNKLDLQGCFEATLQRGDNVTKEIVYVIKGLQTPLAGRSTILKLDLISEINAVAKNKEDIITQFPELFNRLGRLKGSYRIELEQEAKPYSVSTPRRVPIPLLPKVKQELRRMESDGVITRIEEPTDWCAGIVVVPKPNDKVRICVDLTKLNRYVKRERHILPSVDHVLAQIGEAKIFSKLDANSGYWQIELSPESSKLTTFITPFGRYRFNRLPFGISSAPEVFQRRMSEILKDCEGVVGLTDDHLIYGKTAEEHHRRLIAVLEVLKSHGISLNKEKCKFYTNEISFLGYIINEKGISADPKKTQAIYETPKPTNVSEVRRFLGMVNQLNKFSPRLAELTKPIRDLLSSKKQWYWGPDQEEAFGKLKKSLCSEQCLALFDPNKDTVVSADASAYGLGAVLRQRQADGTWRPVTYISRSMSECEQRYAQIEKEALALTWACERLSQYLIGSKFLIETDHKPLVPLLSSKNLDELPIRIQRFRLRLMRYHYDIKHVPGKELNTADYLSRAPLPDSTKSNLTEETEEYVNFIMENLPASDKRLIEIQQAQDSDQTIRKWKDEIQKGRREKRYRKYSDLSIHSGLLMRGNRIVIPPVLQKEVLSQIHSGHQGIHKCKERARCTVWWPGINTDLEEYVKSCRICCQFQRPQFEPLMPSELPNTPWLKVGTDLFEWERTSYLLVVDYYSRYIEIARLSSTTSKSVINHLKSIFARHGIPQIIVSDNGPQYSSSEFERFVSEYKILHKTSSPYFPQSNGEAERAVQTVKGLLKRSNDPYMGLLAYRATPLKIGYSPAELLMGRKLRTTVPVSPELLHPKSVDKKSIKERDKLLKQKQKENYDRQHKAADQEILEPGDEVWIQDQESQGVIVNEQGPRSYQIRTPTGVVRRNRRSLNRVPRPETSQETERRQDSSTDSNSPPSSSSGDSDSQPEPRRSSRLHRPPERYGVWVKEITRTGREM